MHLLRDSAKKVRRQSTRTKFPVLHADKRRKMSDGSSLIVSNDGSNAVSNAVSNADATQNLVSYLRSGSQKGEDKEMKKPK